MYLNCMIPIPEARGKLSREKHGATTYIKYEYDRTYDPEKKYTYPKRTTIGKLDRDNPDQMQPNELFLKYFPEIELPFSESKANRSSCLRIGTYAVISKIIRDYKLKETLGLYFKEKDMGLFLDLAVYAIIMESNVGQHYPDYAYNHPLFTPDMTIYSDATVSNFLQSVTDEQSVGFLNEWNGSRSYRDKIYISYDSTNKNCQAGDLEMVELGHPKIDVGSPIVNLAIGYDTKNREPLFYEEYPGSITDVSQLELMVQKAKGYGYKKVGFILDRGYFSKANIEHMDACGYSFVIIVKGMASFVSELILDHIGSFEKKRSYDVDDYGLHGKTVKTTLYDSDDKERYFHIYHSVKKEADEILALEEKIKEMKRHLNKHLNEEITFGPQYHKYFYLHYDNDTGRFVYAEEKVSVTEREISLCGYFVLVSSERMTAKEAIHFYKGRDVSEKTFAADKTFLGSNCLRVHSQESASAKLFVEFVALIIRNKIYTCLIDEMKLLEKKVNYMSVPAAIRELEKIEMVRQTDNVYRLDHAVTATQKKILHAFGMTENTIKYYAAEIGNQLKGGVSNGKKN